MCDEGSEKREDAENLPAICRQSRKAGVAGEEGSRGEICRKGTTNHLTIDSFHRAFRVEMAEFVYSAKVYCVRSTNIQFYDLVLTINIPTMCSGSRRGRGRKLGKN